MGKHIKAFSSHAEQELFVNSKDYIEPYVGYDLEHVHYNISKGTIEDNPSIIEDNDDNYLVNLYVTLKRNSIGKIGNIDYMNVEVIDTNMNKYPEIEGVEIPFLYKKNGRAAYTNSTDYKTRLITFKYESGIVSYQFYGYFSNSSSIDGRILSSSSETNDALKIYDNNNMFYMLLDEYLQNDGDTCTISTSYEINLANLLKYINSQQGSIDTSLISKRQINYIKDKIYHPNEWYNVPEIDIDYNNFTCNYEVHSTHYRVAFSINSNGNVYPVDIDITTGVIVDNTIAIEYGKKLRNYILDNLVNYDPSNTYITNESILKESIFSKIAFNHEQEISYNGYIYFISVQGIVMSNTLIYPNKNMTLPTNDQIRNSQIWICAGTNSGDGINCLLRDNGEFQLNFDYRTLNYN